MDSIDKPFVLAMGRDDLDKLPTWSRVAKERKIWSEKVEAFTQVGHEAS